MYSESPIAVTDIRRSLAVSSQTFMTASRFRAVENCLHILFLKIYCKVSTGWHKTTGTFEKPNKNWRIPRKKNFIDRNWAITTCLLRDSNPNYQCLKITSCRWRPPPRMHSFTATTHFKSSRSFVSPCVCCMLCRMRQSRFFSYQSVWTRYLIHQDNNFVIILPVSFHVNFLGSQNVNYHLIYLCYGSLNSLLVTP